MKDTQQKPVNELRCSVMEQIEHKEANLNGQKPGRHAAGSIGQQDVKTPQNHFRFSSRGKTLGNICFCQETFQQMHIFRGFVL